VSAGEGLRALSILAIAKQSSAEVSVSADAVSPIGARRLCLEALPHLPFESGKILPIHYLNRLAFNAVAPRLLLDQGMKGWGECCLDRTLEGIRVLWKRAWPRTVPPDSRQAIALTD
jgi:hypothetical protein